MKITRRGFVKGAGAATAVGMFGVPYLALGAARRWWLSGAVPGAQRPPSICAWPIPASTSP